MNNVITFTLDNIGRLYLEQILVEFDIPEFFICIDGAQHRYAVLCTDSSSKSINYIIVKTTPIDLVRMLKKNITMKDLFLNGSENKVWHVNSEGNIGNEKIKLGNLKDVPSNLLPDDNAYFECADPRLSKYLIKLEKILLHGETSKSIAPIYSTLRNIIQEQKY